MPEPDEGESTAGNPLPREAVLDLRELLGFEFRPEGRIERDVIGAVGSYRIGKHGYLYDENGMQMGIWGVNGEFGSER